MTALEVQRSGGGEFVLKVSGEEKRVFENALTAYVTRMAPAAPSEAEKAATLRAKLLYPEGEDANTGR